MNRLEWKFQEVLEEWTKEDPIKFWQCCRFWRESAAFALPKNLCSSKDHRGWSRPECLQQNVMCHILGNELLVSAVGSAVYQWEWINNFKVKQFWPSVKNCILLTIKVCHDWLFCFCVLTLCSDAKPFCKGFKCGLEKINCIWGQFTSFILQFSHNSMDRGQENKIVTRQAWNSPRILYSELLWTCFRSDHVPDFHISLHQNDYFHYWWICCSDQKSLSNCKGCPETAPRWKTWFVI